MDVNIFLKKVWRKGSEECTSRHNIILSGKKYGILLYLGSGHRDELQKIALCSFVCI